MNENPPIQNKSAPEKKESKVPSLWITGPFLFFVTLGVFSGSWTNQFVHWDDPQVVFNNPFIKSFEPDNLWSMMTRFHASNWFPVTWLSHALDYKLYRYSPGGHHLTSVLLHSLNAFWVFLLFRELVSRAMPGRWDPKALWLAGMVAALLFGLHPLRVESVTWVSERKDVLCAFFVLLAYFLYLRYAFDGQGNRRKWGFFAVLGSFVLAIGSKPMAVTVPVVLLLLDVFPLRRINNLRTFIKSLIEKLPFFAVSLACIWITVMAQQRIIWDIEKLDLFQRAMVSVRGVSLYIVKTLFPTGLVPFYPFPEHFTAFSGWFIGSALLFIAVSVFCRRAWKRGQRFWAVAWLYYLVTLSPVIGIVQVGRQSAADRYTYLPSLAIFLLAGFGFLYFSDRLKRSFPNSLMTRFFLGLVVYVLIFFGCLTVTQIKIWRDSHVFWKKIVDTYSTIQTYFAHSSLGNVYQRNGLYDLAEAEYKIAIRMAPKLAHIHFNMGLNYYAQKDLENAEKKYLDSLRLQPKFTIAHYNLGILYKDMELDEKAEKQFEEALKVQPTFAPALLNLGKLHYENGKKEQAVEKYKAALEYRADYYPAHSRLGVYYFDEGRIEDAKREFEKALELNSEYAEAKEYLDRIENQGQKDEATDSKGID